MRGPSVRGGTAARPSSPGVSNPSAAEIRDLERAWGNATVAVGRGNVRPLNQLRARVGDLHFPTASPFSVCNLDDHVAGYLKLGFDQRLQNHL
jgi:hypothetical protein